MRVGGGHHFDFVKIKPDEFFPFSRQSVVGKCILGENHRRNSVGNLRYFEN